MAEEDLKGVAVLHPNLDREEDNEKAEHVDSTQTAIVKDVVNGDIVAADSSSSVEDRMRLLHELESDPEVEDTVGKLSGKSDTAGLKVKAPSPSLRENPDGVSTDDTFFGALLTAISKAASSKMSTDSSDNEEDSLVVATNRKHKSNKTASVKGGKDSESSDENGINVSSKNKVKISENSTVTNNVPSNLSEVDSKTDEGSACEKSYLRLGLIDSESNSNKDASNVKLTNKNVEFSPSKRRTGPRSKVRRRSASLEILSDEDTNSKTLVTKSESGTVKKDDREHSGSESEEQCKGGREKGTTKSGTEADDDQPLNSRLGELKSRVSRSVTKESKKSCDSSADSSDEEAEIKSVKARAGPKSKVKQNLSESDNNSKEKYQIRNKKPISTKKSRGPKSRTLSESDTDEDEPSQQSMRKRGVRSPVSSEGECNQKKKFSLKECSVLLSGSLCESESKPKKSNATIIITKTGPKSKLEQNRESNSSSEEEIFTQRKKPTVRRKKNGPKSKTKSESDSDDDSLGKKSNKKKKSNVKTSSDSSAESSDEVDNKKKSNATVIPKPGPKSKVKQNKESDSSSVEEILSQVKKPTIVGKKVGPKSKTKLERDNDDERTSKADKRKRPSRKSSGSSSDGKSWKKSKVKSSESSEESSDEAAISKMSTSITKPKSGPKSKVKHGKKEQDSSSEGESDRQHVKKAGPRSKTKSVSSSKGGRKQTYESSESSGDEGKKSESNSSSSNDGTSQTAHRMSESAESSDEGSKKSKKTPSSELPPDKDRRIVRLKKLIRAAGFTGFRYSEHWAKCRSNNQRAKALVEFLHKKGIHGRPSLTKCQKLREKLEREKEVQELDVSNIISGYKGSRSTRSAATVYSRVAEERKKNIRQKFARIKDLVDKDDSDSE